MKRVLMVAGAALVAVSFGYPTSVRAEGAEKGKGGGRGEMLKNFDKDGDGKLNDEEKAAAKAAWEAKRAEEHKAMLAKFDKDGDGKLNDEEMKAMHEARKAEMEKKFDTDGDGKLSDVEKAAMDKAMSEHKGKGGHRGAKGAAGKPACEKAPEAAPAPAAN